MSFKNKNKESGSGLKIPKYIKYILCGVLFILIALFFAHKIMIVNADIGRHIKNGEIFIRTGKILSTNTYSYTETSFPTVTHHWGSGVVFYLTYKIFSFKGLSMLYILFFFLTIFLFFKTALNRSNFIYALFCTAIVIPLITSRTEIRPELFSYFFTGLFYYLLHQYYNEKISFKKTFILLVSSMLLWVNLHIYFIFGWFLTGMFVFDSLINKDKSKYFKQLLILFISSIIITLLNPFGIKALIEPFMIMKEYGYMVAENQNIIFIQKRFDNAMYLQTEILFFAVIVTYIFILRKGGIKKFITPLLIILFFASISFKMIRNIPFFGLFFIPVISENLYALQQNYFSYKRIKTFQKTLLAISLLAIFFCYFSKEIIKEYDNEITKQYELLSQTGIDQDINKINKKIGTLEKRKSTLRAYSPFTEALGLGTYKGISNSIEFFKYANIQGPIFNNYDIGGFLIFYLYPYHKVFVDNRPEAYSVDFFKKVYMPVLADDNEWIKLEMKYNFNCIFFYRYDNTTYGQPFLIRRLEDSTWAAVYADKNDPSIIFLKRNEQNAEIIKTYELPKSMFGVSKGQ